MPTLHMFLAIDHPAIACYDPKSQIDWYCRVLGMKVIAKNDASPPTAIVGYGDGVTIELMPARDSGARPESSARFAPGLRHLALRVKDFDSAYEHLLKAGIKFLGEPATAIGGGRIVSFRDPEGNELQIVERPASSSLATGN